MLQSRGRSPPQIARPQSTALHSQKCFQFFIDGMEYALEYQYLVDMVGTDCLLRLKPSDSVGPEYCNRLCPGLHLNGICDEKMMNFQVVFGLPFLHRYCVRYDETQAVASVAARKSLRGERCYYEPDPPVKDGDSSSSPTTTTTAVSRTTPTTAIPRTTTSTALSSTSHTTKGYGERFYSSEMGISGHAFSLCKTDCR